MKEQPTEINRGDIWDNIYAQVKQIPRKKTKGDAEDAVSVTTKLVNIISTEVERRIEERMPKEEEATEQIKTYEPVYKEALYMEGCVHGFMAAWRWFRSRMKGDSK